MHTARFVAGSALALGLELTGLAPLTQPPANPPNPVPPINPTPQPAPNSTPLPPPKVPQRTPADQSTPGGPARNANPSTTASNPSATRMIRPFALQSPQMESRLTETSHRLSQMEQRLDQSNQDLLRRLGQARQLSGERQNAALMDVLQQLLQNNAEMQRYLVEARMGWLGLPEDAATDATTGQQPPTAVPDANPPR